MAKQGHTFLCWLLVISLVWLPFSASAETFISSTSKNNCHDVPVRILQSVNSDQISSIAKSTIQTKSTIQNCCCDDGCENCIAASSCNMGSYHVPVFILANLFAFDFHFLSQLFIEQSVRYHNQIISPDYHPPTA